MSRKMLEQTMAKIMPAGAGGKRSIVRWRQTEAIRAMHCLEAIGLEIDRLEFEPSGKMVIVPRRRGEGPLAMALEPGKVT